MCSERYARYMRRYGVYNVSVLLEEALEVLKDGLLDFNNLKDGTKQNDKGTH